MMECLSNRRFCVRNSNLRHEFAGPFPHHPKHDALCSTQAPMFSWMEKEIRGLLHIFICVYGIFVPQAVGVSTVGPQNKQTLLTTRPLDNTSLPTTRESREIQCLLIRHAYGGKGINGIQVPRRAVNGDHLKICSQETTCCTQETESKLSALARQDYEKLFQEHVNRFKSLLISRTARIDEFITDLLKTARHNLHEMFSRTYGDSYRANVAIFTDLFEDLEKYYRGTRGHVNVDLQASMHRFFSRLYEKMFVMLNPGMNLGKDNFQCILRHMDKAKPFGEVADRLVLQVKQAFVDARTFVQALAFGRDAAKTASEILLTPQCINSLTGMMYCAQCRGLYNLKPCHPYCLGVMKFCLAQHIQLDQEWNQYVDALILLADRLKGSVNIETVVAPINVKISEAIMNLQENGGKISQLMTKECGPFRVIKRSVRAASVCNSSKPTPPKLTTLASVTLDQLCRDIKEKLLPTKDFWSILPSQLCSDYGKSFKSPVRGDCWNGLAKAKWTTSASESAVPGRHGKMTKSVDPLSDDYNSGAKSVNPAVLQTIQQLYLATTRLKQAYDGTDVDTVENAADNEDVAETSGELTGAPEDVEGSGSGSGSTEEPDNIDEDDEDFVEGSGVTTASPTHSTTSASPPRIRTPRVTVAIDVQPTTHAATPPDFHFETTTTTTTTPRTTEVVTTAATTLRQMAKTPAPHPTTPSTASLTHVHSSLVLIAAAVVLWWSL